MNKFQLLFAFSDKLNSTAFAPVKMDFSGNIKVGLLIKNSIKKIIHSLKADLSLRKCNKSNHFKPGLSVLLLRFRGSTLDTVGGAFESWEVHT